MELIIHYARLFGGFVFAGLILTGILWVTVWAIIIGQLIF